MSLQFIFGNAGAGKSHYLYQWVIEESMKYPEKNYIVLVPEQFTMQTQKDLVLKHPRNGIMNIDVLSFVRLAHRIFEEVGGNTKVILDDVGKNLVLRRIAGQYEAELKVLRGNLKRLGYIAEVKSVISEFTQYNIGAEEIEQMMENVEEDSYLYHKLNDIKIVYEGFKKYLEGAYITGEELLDVLSDVVTQSEILKGSVVVLDGFTGFTPVQDRLLGQLMRVCEKVVVTVTMDKREDPFLLNHRYQLFALSKQMVTGLVKIAEQERIQIEEPVTLYEEPAYRFRETPALAFLEREIFRSSKAQYEKAQENVSVYCAKNPKEEVEAAAKRIRAAVRTKGYRYQDIAVITNDMSVYADYIEQIFPKYDIPVFMDHKRSVLLNSFVEYLRSLLAMVEKNFTYESVVRFLRAGLSGFSYPMIDKLENYMIALGIKGYKKWQEKWVRLTGDMSAEELSELNHMRVTLVEKLDPLVFVLKQRKKTVRDITEALYQFFVQEDIQKELKRYETRFQDDGELVLAKEYAQIYRITMELFDKFVELLGDEVIPLKEYCELLDSGLEEAKVAVIPPSMDQVVAGDIERTRLKDIKILFLMGANDTLIPGKMGADGLLSERDREKFADADFVLAPGAKEKIYIQKFYLYLNLTKPTKQLMVSYSKVSAEGKGLRPAYLVSDLKRLYPLLHVRDEEQEKLSDLEISKSTGISCIIKGLRDKRMQNQDSYRELYAWYAAQDEWREYLKSLTAASVYRRNADALPGHLAEALYGNTERLSVTRLETFSSCAFAHFLKYGLRLRERKEYEFEALDLGNVLHSALEKYAQKIDESVYGWQDVPEDEKEKFIEECVSESITDYGNTVLYSTARNEYMITRMKRVMQRTIWGLTRQLEKGDFEPKGYEVNFGSGKIDRIDTCEDGDTVYVKIIDYKTGMKAFDMTAFYYGLQLQLVLYMDEAVKREKKRNPGKEVVPAGIFYYRIKDPIVEKEIDEAKLEQAILKELKLDGIVNREEAVIRHLDKELSGNSLVVPVGRNKDNSLSKLSKTMTEEEFSLLFGHTRKKMGEAKEEILRGNVDAAPYELGGATGCDYCNYRDVCGFDERIAGYEYRRLRQLKKEEILEKMKEEE